MSDFLDTEFAEFEQSLIESQTLADKKAWEDITSARNDFFLHNIDPRSSGAVRLEVAESWIRSREMGLDPDSPALSIPLDDKSFQKLCEKNKQLIEVAHPILNSISNLDLVNDYIFEVVDQSGVSLIQTGNLNLHDFVAAQSIFNETTMGTCAHALCLQHEKPFQIVGVEHYSTVLHGLSAIAMPIFDENARVIATLLLTQPILADPWKPEFIHMHDHTWGLILNLASSIEFKLQLRTTQSLLFTAENRTHAVQAAKERVDHILDVAVGINKEGLIVINKKGIIQHANPEAIYLLRKPIEAIAGKNIEELLDFGLMELLEQDLGIKKSIPFSLGNDALSLKAVAVMNDDVKDYDGFVLTICKPKENLLGSRRTTVGDTASFRFDDILGDSPAIKESISLAKRYAMTDENILLTGESGTGKECFAQAIHNYSRPNGPFMSINCAAIPPRLVESELFGYEAGSFTGADRAGRAGKIELADGGTLFLDEIGDMPLDLQATLLRVIENKRIMRLGGKSYRQADFRVIAATNQDLSKMVKTGLFREDLFYRLSVLSIRISPLHERPEDKVMFAHYFLNECKRKNGAGPSSFDPDTLKIMESFEWPGNVRQIKNSITSAFYSADGSQISPEDLPSRVTSAYFSEAIMQALSSPEKQSNLAIEESLSLRSLEEQAIGMAMKRVNNNVAQAADLLGISKATLYRKLGASAVYSKFNKNQDS